MSNKTIESKFPEVISNKEIKELNAKPIKNMNYLKLEIRGRVGIYEPLEKDEDGRITYYIRRNIFPREINEY